MTAHLVPEQDVTTPERSPLFYTDVLGFEIAYERAEDQFVHLRLGGAELMLEKTLGRGRITTGQPVRPFCRGMNPQIQINDLDTLLGRLDEAETAPLLSTEEGRYRRARTEVGNRQVWIQDPDGYLLRFHQDLGERPMA
ncbi:MAG: VOC family protein [Actinomycetia bacterium]|nr:VOC family protein [Actinomycetes bacterium]